MTRGIIQGSHLSHVIQNSSETLATSHPDSPSLLLSHFLSPSLSLSRARLRDSQAPRNSSKSSTYFTNAFPFVPSLIDLRKSNENLGYK